MYFYNNPVTVKFKFIGGTVVYVAWFIWCLERPKFSLHCAEVLWC
jgi:hypothetical protein